MNLIKKIKIFIDLTVPQYVAITIFNSILFWIIINQNLNVNTNLLLVILSLSLAILGLNAFNQVYDINIDKISKPNRPIPSSKIKKETAFYISILFFIISIIFTLPTNILTTSLMLLFILISIVYSLPPIRLKTKLGLSNLVGGTLYGAIPFICVWLISPVDHFPILFFLFFYVLAINIATIKDLEDMETEKQMNIKTIPVLIGNENSVKLIFFILIITLLIIAISSLINLVDNKFIFPSTLAIFISLIAYKLSKNYNITNFENVKTQAPIVNFGMGLILIIELLFGIATLLI
ncbi:MAG: UbiA family prenyltransferase [Candidatus Diapherotrites archaeon]|nr:UbiA family prenyltransferase [Candidatus Diapherotrites archaeon]